MYSMYSIIIMCVVSSCLSSVCIRLEDIGASASKEYSLEKAMEKMKSEWSTQVFGFVNHRDTVSVHVHCIRVICNDVHVLG